MTRRAKRTGFFRGAGWRAGIATVGLMALAACSSGDDAAEPSAAADATTPKAEALDTPRCARGDALVARVRALQTSGDEAAMQQFTQAMRAGAANTTDQDQERTGCAGFETLSPDQTETYVDLIYHGGAGMTPALVFGQTEAARRAILTAYRADPDPVSDDPSLAAALAMAQIASGESYEAAYEDLAFAALNDGIDPRYVRGYLTHFGCAYEDAVWAAKTRERADFLQGEAFPTSTSPDTAGEGQLVADRMALLQRGEVPALRAACPLSARYAADHNGDALTRLKFRARQWADTLHERFDGYADGFGASPEPADESETPAPADGMDFEIDGLDVEAWRARLIAQLQALEQAAWATGTAASTRLRTCRARLDQGFMALVECLGEATEDPPAEDPVEPAGPDDAP